MRMIAAVLTAGCVTGLLASPTSASAPIACIADGTPAEVIAAQITMAAQASPQAGSALLGWTRTATDGSGLSRGEPITLTWSVVPDGTPIDGAGGQIDSDGPSDLEAFLNQHHGVEAEWLDLIQQALDGWSTGPGITFVYEPNDDGSKLGVARGVLGVRADIRIGGHPIDDRDLGVAAYAFFPDHGDIVIDTFEDVSSFNAHPGQFSNVISHEAGHSLGLGHTCPIDQSKLMEPLVTLSFFGPQLDDLLGAHRNYGDLEEENDNAAEAADIGLSIDTTTIDDRLALDGRFDDDWFVVPAGSSSRVTVALDPVGATYPFGVVDGTGNCDEVNPNFDSTRIQDMDIKVIDFDGTTIESANATGAGGSELLIDVPLSILGGFIRINGSGTDDTQAYELQITLVPEPSSTLSTTAALITLLAIHRRRLTHS
jgi:hypothetical protein